MLVRSPPPLGRMTAHSFRNPVHILGFPPRSPLSPSTARLLTSQPRTPSRHAQFYTDYAAAMIPVALLGSAVYIGLRTWQQHLAHEKFLEEEHVHVQQLQAEVAALRQQQQHSPEVTLQVQRIPANNSSRWWFW